MPLACNHLLACPCSCPTPQEANAARTISAQRGVMLVGTAHGSDLRSLLAQPELNRLVGGASQHMQHMCQRPSRKRCSLCPVCWLGALRVLCPSRAVFF